MTVILRDLNYENSIKRYLSSGLAIIQRRLLESRWHDYNCCPIPNTQQIKVMMQVSLILFALYYFSNKRHKFSNIKSWGKILFLLALGTILMELSDWKTEITVLPSNWSEARYDQQREIKTQSVAIILRRLYLNPSWGKTLFIWQYYCYKFIHK